MMLGSGCRSLRLRWLATVASAAFLHATTFCAASIAQQNPVVASPANDSPEISQTEVVTTFNVRVNQVLVRVVVRDSQSKAISGLKREDFVLLDGGERQPIVAFSEMKAGATAPAPDTPSAQARNELAESPTSQTGEIPTRFLVLLFDDMHLNASTLPRVRAAAEALVYHSLLPSDRVAILSTSGLVHQDFTSDRNALHAALQHLSPESMLRDKVNDCPYMDSYFAERLGNEPGPFASRSSVPNATGPLAAAIAQTIECARLRAHDSTVVEKEAQRMVMAAANASLNSAQIDRSVLLASLKSSIRLLAGVVGKREIVFASPGFFLEGDQMESSRILEEALHDGVIIDALDVRGLWTDQTFHAETIQLDPTMTNSTTNIVDYMRDEEKARADSMAEWTETTGGRFFHNNNDLNEGMHQFISEPESTYMLAFNPRNLKSDGKFHSLKVKLASGMKYEISARKGYYAPRKETDPEQAAKQEVEDTFFSQEELQEIPLEVHTQFFKPTQTSAKLSVIARIDLQTLRFRHEQERSLDTLTEVCGVFDRNGHFVSGLQKTIDLRLREVTRAKLNSGISVKSVFDVSSGSYLVRVVLRDKEGQKVSARSVAVEIP